MDCLSQLEGLDQILTSQDPQTLTSVMKDVRKAHYPEEIRISSKDFLHPIVGLVNRPEFIACLLYLQKFTTEPSWFSVMGPLLIKNSTFKERVVQNYRTVGFSTDFIDQVLLFPSGRPKVDLSTYVKELSVEPQHAPKEYYDHILPHFEDPTYLSNALDGFYDRAVIPVIRYQKGMFGYLTVLGSEERVWCGTFYYYEPDSPFLLYSPTTLVTWNKITGCLDLEVDFETVFQIFYDGMKNYQLTDDQDNLFDATPELIGFAVSGGTKEEQWREIIQNYQNRENIDPLQHIPELYAAEDGLDQLLCQQARDHGIDTVVLKFMTGYTRVVSEVLDVRDRNISFEHLLLPPLLD